MSAHRAPSAARARFDAAVLNAADRSRLFRLAATRLGWITWTVEPIPVA